MKAAWETGSIKTDEERIRAVDFAADLGFDTMVTGSSTEGMVAHAHDRGVQVIAVVTPSAGGGFSDAHPGCVQKLREYEYDILKAMEGQNWLQLHGMSFHWQAPLLPRPMVCFSHPESVETLKTRVEAALELTDGVALDGFGFNNYYACFCKRCDDHRSRIRQAHPKLSDLEVLGRASTQTLIDIHRTLHDHAKSIKPEAIVTNHVWPMFLPDEHIGTQYKLDYCTQTISWFYPPEWRLERVEAEAAELKRLEDPKINRFVPFIGIVDIPDLVRTPERLSAEIEIALKYGEGNLCLSRLWTLQNHPQLADAVKEALNS